MDFNEQKCDSLRLFAGKRGIMTFYADWLIAHGARRAGKPDVEAQTFTGEL